MYSRGCESERLSRLSPLSNNDVRAGESLASIHVPHFCGPEKLTIHPQTKNIKEQRDRFPSIMFLCLRGIIKLNIYIYIIYIYYNDIPKKTNQSSSQKHCFGMRGINFVKQKNTFKSVISPLQESTWMSQEVRIRSING